MMTDDEWLAATTQLVVTRMAPGWFTSQEILADEAAALALRLKGYFGTGISPEEALRRFVKDDPWIQQTVQILKQRAPYLPDDEATLLANRLKGHFGITVVPEQAVRRFGVELGDDS
jgi:hypothetical protein